MALAELSVAITADGVDATIRDVQKVSTAIEQAAQNAANIGNAFAAFGTVAAIVGTAAVALYSFGKAAVDAALPLDSYRAGIAALSASVSDYESQIKRLTDIAKLPGLGLEEVFRGAAQLQGAGIGADVAATSIKELGNAIASVGRGKAEFSLAVDQLAKMAGLGKVTTEDLNQIAAYAPSVRTAFQRALGTLDADEIKKKGLSIEEIFRRVNVELAKNARGAVSFQVAIDNLADSAQIAMEPLGTGLLTAFNRQTTYAQSFFDDLQKINEELALMIMRTSAMANPMQAAFGSPIIMLLRAFDDNISDIVANLVQAGMNIEEFGYNAQLAFVRLLKAPLALIDPAIGRGTDTGYKNYTQYDDVRRALQMQKDVMDGLAIASLSLPKIGGKPPVVPPDIPPKDKDKESKNHLRKIEANTRATADALTLARQTFGGNQLGQLGITAVELNNADRKFRGSNQIPGSTLINRGIQQLINQSQRSYNDLPFARY